MCGVLDNVPNSAEAPGGVNVCQGEMSAVNHPLYCFNCPLKPDSVRLSAAPGPNGNAVCQRALNGLHFIFQEDSQGSEDTASLLEDR